MFKNELSVDRVVIANQFAKEKKYWLDKLQGELEKTYFPYDFPRNNEDHHEEKHKIDLHFSREIDSRLLSIAGNSERRLLMLLAAGLVVLLHKYTDSKDIIIGTPILKQKVQGDFVNTLLILRQRLEPGTTFKELLYMVKQTLVEAAENQNYPIKSLIRELNLHPSISGDENPFFDCIILLENIHERGYIEDSTYGILFSFKVEQEKIPGHIEYNPALYNENTINQIARHFRHLFGHVLFNLDLPLREIAVLTGDDKRRLLYEFNNNTISIDFNTIVDRFENQVKKNPHRIALEYDNQQIDYLELNQRANKLARVLIHKGMRQDCITALILRPALEMVIAILAVLKTGGAYLPIDPALPGTRIEYIINDSCAKYLVTGSKLRETLPYLSQNLFKGEIFMAHHDYSEENDANIGVQYKSDALAYVIYTSGTTGLPKGVLIEHKGIINYSEWRYHTYRYSDQDVTLQLLSYNFDGFNSNLYSSLISGGTLILLLDSKMLDIGYIIGLIKTRGVTNTSIIPRIFDLIIEQAEARELKSMRFVVLAGEKAGEKQVEKIKNKNPGIILVNEYGPSELTVTAAANPHMEKNTTSVIGKPISNTKIFILNSTFDLVPPGVTGELYAAGPGLARGYLNNSLLTQEKFVENPFEKGSFLYRTGDLARWLLNGNIEFAGRIDHQVKVRGYRIEPEEIERQLLKHKEIKETIITTRQDDKGDSYICAYIIPQKNITVHELREYLSTYLPEYMIPAYFVSLEEWPLSTSGKVDRKRLPPPQVSVSLEKYAGPRDKVEKKLTEIWSEILGIDEDTISIDANFFELGGHSLRATVLSNQVYKELNVKIPMIQLFQSPIIRSMAEYIKASCKDIYDSIQPAEQRAFYPLSSAQHRLYVLQNLAPGSTAYNVFSVFQTEGELEKEKLERAFRELIRRHESLRTSMEMEGQNPLQRIHPAEGIGFKIQYNDLEGEESESMVKEKIKKFLRPFNLADLPLIRVGLIKINPIKHLLMVDMHHIITDGVSIVILWDEFLRFYSGASRTPLKLQYKDYSLWQQSYEGQKAIKNQKEYWLKRFAGEIPILNMPIDFARPPIQSFEGRNYIFKLGREETQALNRLARSEGATLFMVLLSIYYILLSKLSSQEDIVVGTPIAGRKHADLQQIIGIFLNMLSLRNYPHSEYSFIQFLGHLKESTLEAYDNQDYPFEDLVEQISLERDTSRNPLFDVVFILQNIYDTPEAKSAKEIKGLKINLHSNERSVSQFDLNLEATESNDNLTFRFEYCTRLYKTRTIRRFADYYKKIVNQVIENPGKKIADMGIISGEEKKRVLYDFNDTETEYPKDKTIHRLFEEQVERTPDNMALVGQNPKSRRDQIQKGTGGLAPLYITYRELNEKSNRLGHELQTKGVSPDTIVGIIIERSVEMVVGILSILKSGGAYLPIDPEYPAERINYMLADSGTKILLAAPETQVKVKAEVKESFGQPPQLPLEFIDIETKSASTFERPPSTLTSTSTCQVSPANLAYIIYTSGTTGNPKGVMIEHHSLVNRLNWMQEKYPLHDSDTIMQKTPFTFDVSVWEILWWAMVGAKVCLLIPGGEKDPKIIIDTIERHKITVMHFVPSMLSVFLDYLQENRHAGNAGRLVSLKQVIASGEELTVSQVEKFNQILGNENSTPLANLYGPTEATIDVSYYNCPGENNIEIIPIGKPIDNIRLYILDKNLQIQPVGIPGHLHISGAGLARGYLNQPGLTAEKFDHDLWDYQDDQDKRKKVPGKRIYSLEGTRGLAPLLYRTGDLAKWLPDGNIKFLGRIDSQVKIRGFRIEPGEIESRLLKHSSIKDAAVIAGVDETGAPHLCAYIVPIDNKEIKVPGLSDFLLKKLPGYMIPSYIIPLNTIPLTPNGKLDRQSLPRPGEVEALNNTEYAPPRNEIEQNLVDTWESTLGRRNIGINENFFLIGGDSIKAIQIIARMKKNGYIVKMQDIYRKRKISELSPLVKKVERMIDQKIITGEIPLTPIQENFFSSCDIAPHHFNHSVLLYSKEKIDIEIISTVFRKIQEHHDGLRVTFRRQEGKIIQTNHGIDYPLSIQEYDLMNKENPGTHLEQICSQAQASIDLENGPLMKIGLFKMENGDYLFIVVHHLVIDGISWRILLEDLESAYRHYQGTTKDQPELEVFPLKTDSYKYWSEKLQQYSIDSQLLKQIDYWREVETLPINTLPVDHSVDPRLLKKKYNDSVNFQLSLDHTGKLLTEIHHAYNTEINDILLAALALSLYRWTGMEYFSVCLEGHGREEIMGDIDVSRTIGWFTSLYPVILQVPPRDNKPEPQFLAQTIKINKERLRKIPVRGIGYGVLRYLTPPEKKKELSFTHKPQISFNYMGQFEQENVGGPGNSGNTDKTDETKVFSLSRLGIGNTSNPEQLIDYTIDISGIIMRNQLTFTIAYNTKQYNRSTIEDIANNYKSYLLEIIKHCGSKEDMEKTLSDYTITGMEEEGLENVYQVLGDLFNS